MNPLPIFPQLPDYSYAKIPVMGMALVWSTTKVGHPFACWPYTSNLDTWLPEWEWDVLSARRLAYSTTIGRVGSDDVVLCRCNNFTCINPHHLYKAYGGL